MTFTFGFLLLPKWGAGNGINLDQPQCFTLILGTSNGGAMLVKEHHGLIRWAPTLKRGSATSATFRGKKEVQNSETTPPVATFDLNAGELGYF